MKVRTIVLCPGSSEIANEGLGIGCLHSGVGLPVAGLNQGVLIQQSAIQ